ncbi:Guanylate cyclase soluble subunit beta-2 [Tetrabaena socialis]|uniref:Guanylate cyclase soluble subunit beta-2 n=1 Tax=Tetrabaena socialis TaxID=47790 RepID=A0A2J7ZSN9_9CHLO|nr:Guanylate cyclase soluble subunit beta-2 [Tetrabaena socialis]|eukprot:PNH03287.1 Guanylate cyclase soluble subunit beta-2 [Tetrabaena socialis]
MALALATAAVAVAVAVAATLTETMGQTQLLASQQQQQVQQQQVQQQQDPQEHQQQRLPPPQPLHPPGWRAAGSTAPTADSCVFHPPSDSRERWHEVIMRPVADPMSSEPVLLLVQTDVTSRVRAETQLLDALEAEHRLLADIFPAHIDPSSLATHHECITVLFADIRGFTEMSKQVPPATVMRFLNSLYTRFDSLNDLYGVYKVGTIGDCYLVAGGLVTGRDADGYGRAVRGQGDADPLHAMRVVSFARAMLKEAARERLPSTGEPVQFTYAPEGQKFVFDLYVD